MKDDRKEGVDFLMEATRDLDWIRNFNPDCDHGHINGIKGRRRHRYLVRIPSSMILVLHGLDPVHRPKWM